MTDPPALSPEQRAVALERAAEARRVRAEVRRALGSGETGLAEVLEQAHDDLIGGIKVKALLTALPGLGKVKSRRLMEQLGISENRRLRGLGIRQKRALLDALD